MFEHCCYAACHFNLHKAGTRDHEDWFNLLFGMCAVYASGVFDYTRGGYFIAKSLGVVTQFPPTSAIFVPSACVTHSNTPISDNETRSSIAFFVAAGLARWYHNGYMSDKEYKARASASQLAVWQQHRMRLWEAGLELLECS